MRTPRWHSPWGHPRLATACRRHQSAGTGSAVPTATSLAFTRRPSQRSRCVRAQLAARRLQARPLIPVRSRALAAPTGAAAASTSRTGLPACARPVQLCAPCAAQGQPVPIQERPIVPPAQQPAAAVVAASLPRPTPASSVAVPPPSLPSAAAWPWRRRLPQTRLRGTRATARSRTSTRAALGSWCWPRTWRAGSRWPSSSRASSELRWPVFGCLCSTVFGCEVGPVLMVPGSPVCSGRCAQTIGSGAAGRRAGTCARVGMLRPILQRSLHLWTCSLRCLHV